MYRTHGQSISMSFTSWLFPQYLTVERIPATGRVSKCLEGFLFRLEMNGESFWFWIRKAIYSLYKSCVSVNVGSCFVWGHIRAAQGADLYIFVFVLFVRTVNLTTWTKLQGWVGRNRTTWTRTNLRGQISQCSVSFRCEAGHGDVDYQQEQFALITSLFWTRSARAVRAQLNKVCFHVCSSAADPRWLHRQTTVWKPERAPGRANCWNHESGTKLVVGFGVFPTRLSSLGGSTLKAFPIEFVRKHLRIKTKPWEEVYHLMCNN